MSRPAHSFFQILLLLPGLILGGCTDELSPEDEIRQFLELAEQAAEARDASALGELIDKQYSDPKKLNHAQLTGLLRGYFLRNRNIHLFTQVNSIEFIQQNHAHVVVHVAMTAQDVRQKEELGQLRASVYRLELSLVNTDGWKLAQARWEPSGLDNMFK